MYAGVKMQHSLLIIQTGEGNMAADTVTNYTGTASLGLGGNADIPVATPKELDVINQVGRDIYLTNVSRNQQLFQQKIRDRDQMLQAIDSGDLKIGDLLEQDTPIVKKGLEKLDEAWAARMKKGVNDIDAQLAYKKALREAQDTVTQAQARKVFDAQERGALSKETLGRKQEARKKNLDNVIGGGFWKDLTPYQQTQDFDFDPINAYVKPITTEFRDPKNPLMTGKRTIVDYPQVVGNAQKDFLENNDRRQDQIGLMESFQQLPPEKLRPALEAVRARLQEYNKQRGFIQGQPGYIDLNVAEGPNGQLAINETVPDFAAKWALANQPLYSSQTTDFDKDAASFELGKERNRISAANAGANMLRARTYADVQKKKLSQMNDLEKRAVGIWPKVISKVQTAKDATGADVDIVWAGNLPKGYTQINGLNGKGQPIKLTPFKNSKGKEFFKSKFYTTDGNEVDLRAQYDEYKKNGGSGSYDELRKKLLDSGAINLEIQGEDGVGDFNSAMESVRATNNKLSSGKEEPIFQDQNQDEE